jgi:ubiquinol-cytochrome c reductase cytochrome b subunit
MTGSHVFRYPRRSSVFGSLQSAILLAVSVAVLGVCMPASLQAAQVRQAAQTVPNQTDGAAYQRGSVTFAEYGCARCHGKNGMGGHRGPNLSDVGDHLTGARIHAQIENGGKTMPAYAKILDRKQVDDLVEYLSAHRVAPKPKASVAE